MLFNYRMFKESPHVKSLFEKFNGLEAGTSILERSDILAIHGMTVMNAIDDVMCNLDEPSVVIDVLLEQGNAHAFFSERMDEGIFRVSMVTSIPVTSQITDNSTV